MTVDRILVTGGNGFVGRHLISRLADEWPQARVTSCILPNEEQEFALWMDSARLPAEFVSSAPCDIAVPGAAAAVVQATEPEWIFHLAARASGSDTDREAVFRVNVTGTRLLLEAAAALPAESRTLLVSTGYAYGNTVRPARESDELAAPGVFGAYTDSKIAMEREAAGFAQRCVISRSFSHTGPGQSPTFAIPSFAHQLARIEQGLEPPSLLVGNLDAKRDILDVRDVARAYILMMQYGEAGAAYNVATGSPVCMRDVLERLRAMISTPTEVIIDPNRLRPADIACSSGDSARLRELAHWAPEIPLEQTLLSTLNWWRDRIASDAGIPH